MAFGFHGDSGTMSVIYHMVYTVVGDNCQPTFFAGCIFTFCVF